MILPVPGFSTDWMFSISILKFELSDFTIIVCVFLLKLGSAQISSWVFLAPTPARPTAAATLTLAGKALAPSNALSENISFGSFKFSNFIYFRQQI